MDVRQVRPTDAPLVLSLVLDESAHLVQSTEWLDASPSIRTLARSVLPLATAGKTWLAQDRESVALLEARPRQYVIGWDIVRLVVRGDHDPVLSGVVGAAIEHLQSRGVPRLFARCRERASALLRGLEFHTLAREYVLLGPQGQVTENTQLPISARYRMPQDAWPLHQLEMEITPSLVRQFEGLSSQDWSQRTKEMSEIVVERDGKIVAWIGRGTRARRGLLHVGMLVDPLAKELAPDLLSHVIKTAPSEARLFTRVREYQVESLRAFLDAGFNIVGEEMIMVKHGGVERAHLAKGRMRVVNVPGVQAVPFRFGTGLTGARAPYMHPVKGRSL